MNFLHYNFKQKFQHDEDTHIHTFRVQCAFNICEQFNYYRFQFPAFF